jgi:DHA1 family bicyclomycin/chloramphenicol resistance-like MFS transporter
MDRKPRDMIKRPPPWGGPLSSRELVAMIAFCLALNALAIDTMLPALDEIAAHYDVPAGNQQQWIIFSYILGFGVPQLFAGPLSDRFGRKIILRVSFIFYIICGFACMFAPSFVGLLVLRSLQGISAAGIRVTAASIVRDLYAGRGMARIMSLVLTIFMIVPIAAPGLGQIILLITDWRWTFGVLGVAGLIVWGWIELRLPETLKPEDQRALKPHVIASGYKQVITTPVTLGYMLASGVLFGALFAFIGASEQIFSEVFDQEAYFALWFAGIAATLTIVNFVNSRIVETYGMRRISHIALIAFIILSLLNVICAHIFGPKLILFFPIFALTFGCFGMVGANFSALAMEPLGKLAGTGSAAYGFATSTVSSFIGLLVAGQYNGTVIPVLAGYVILGAASLSVVLITEKGRLFRDGTKAD